MNMSNLQNTKLSFRDLRQSKRWMRWIDVLHWFGYILITFAFWWDTTRNQTVRGIDTVFFITLLGLFILYFLIYRVLRYLIVWQYRSSISSGFYIASILVVVIVIGFIIFSLPVLLFAIFGNF